MKISQSIAVLFLSAAAFTSCNDDKDNTENAVNENIKLENFSKEPAFAFGMPGFEDMQITTLISSSDVLPGSPNFVFAGQPDGMGIMKDPASDGYLMLTNHEITQSVSRVYLDRTFKPVKGEYILNGIGGMTRLCSATLATPQEHGFSAFLTAGESGEESMVHAINPMAAAAQASDQTRVKPALGKASMENAVPLPKDVSNGKSYILIGEDQSYSTSHQSAGQLIMYVANTPGDLDNGKLYSLKRTNNNTTETNMTKGSQYDVEFVEITNAKNLTGAQINQKNLDINAIRFSRVEDVDYRKGAGKGREIYFTATGESSDGVNPKPGLTMWGRVYKLVLNESNMLTGKLEVVAEGDSNPGNNLINPDNLCVTENFVYIQEDGDSYYPAATHDSYIWQLNISTKQYKPWLNMKHDRNNPAWQTAYNQSGTLNKFGSWEYGAMIDVSDIIGVPNTFAVNIHSHTWQKDAFKNADGAGVNTNKEGGQIILIRNVQK
ncbi:PhoX family protein [Chryseobacterium sp. 09-1422]|uniref:PhoX family protein n=1 Tax=Chryseobacterium kimseyorum TaxID=2984028 RepID=A0ABT3HXF9_9FLAO|nr:PhoX family protein [Chryseobacterium kimseyorum]MCW3168482.1 PhoX family protein [Chryseobacterium kimseyorum]